MGHIRIAHDDELTPGDERRSQQRHDTDDETDAGNPQLGEGRAIRRRPPRNQRIRIRHPVGLSEVDIGGEPSTVNRLAEIWQLSAHSVEERLASNLRGFVESKNRRGPEG